MCVSVWSVLGRYELGNSLFTPSLSSHRSPRPPQETTSVQGKLVEHITAIKIAHAPPGHHSVIGRPSAGGLNYPEYVVIYCGEQVIPVTKLRFNQSEGCNWNVDRK